MNKAPDEVRASETGRMQLASREPVLKKSRWLLRRGGHLGGESASVYATEFAKT